MRLETKRHVAPCDSQTEPMRRAIGAPSAMGDRRTSRATTGPCWKSVASRCASTTLRDRAWKARLKRVWWHQVQLVSQRRS